MNKLLNLSGLALVATFALTMPGPIEARDLKAESAGPTGLTTVVLQVTARDLGGTDTSISLNTGQTLTRTALKLAAGKIDIGIVPPGAFLAMTKGVGPYREQPDQAIELSANLLSLYSFVGGSAHPIVRANSGIESWEDVKGKRIFIGPPGGAANQQLTALVKLLSGYEMEKDYTPVKMGWGAATQAFQDGQFDVFMQSTAVGSASLVQLFLQGDYRFLVSPEGVQETQAYADFLAANGGVKGGIFANAYEGVENGDIDINTYSYTMLTAVNKDMSDDEAYLLTSTFWENLAENKEEIALLLSVDMNPFAGNNMPLHSGAARYYREKGLEIPAELIAD